jgi:DNA-binding MarR family transcriptional regulator
MSGWTFLTNHAHALTCIARDPDIRFRDMADEIGITERAAHRIVSELLHAGYISREKRGRRNRYEVQSAVPLRHPLHQEITAADLVALMLRNDQTDKQSEEAPLGL